MGLSLLGAVGVGGLEFAYLLVDIVDFEQALLFFGALVLVGDGLIDQFLAILIEEFDGVFGAGDDARVQIVKHLMGLDLQLVLVKKPQKLLINQTFDGEV